MKSPEIRVYLTPEDFPPPESLVGKTAVVIDVLRAFSTAACALANGCQAIIPVLSCAEAYEKASSFNNGRAVLGGERNGFKLENFDFGNSPLEYTRDLLAGKILIFTTTNGTRALLYCSQASRVFTASLLSMESVCRQICESDSDVAIFCAGTDGSFSLEDAVCAGLMAEWLSKHSDTFELSRSASEAINYSKQYKGDLLAMLMESEHGQYLKQHGFGDDLEFCSQLNAVPVVGEFKNGRISRI